MTSQHPSIPDYQWIHVSPPSTVDDFGPYTEASDGLLVTDGGVAMGLAELKSRLDPVSAFRKARARAESNPLEVIGNHFFINRAALKMAEMDALFGLLEEAAQLTTERGERDLKVVDLCGGPGGFVEYLQWRSHQTVTSVNPDRKRPPKRPALEKMSRLSVTGITLGGKDDYRQADFCVDAPVNTFTQVHGPGGDGDILHPEASASVEEALGGRHLAHLSVGDGGFDFAGREEDQERLVLPLLASQLATALSCLCEGGSLMQKLYTVHLPATARLLHLAGSCFEEFTLVKPLTSRPSNSEQYLVAKRRRGGIEAPLKLLESVARSLSAGTRPRLMSPLPQAFLMWLRKTSHTQAVSQMQSLSRMVAYATEPVSPQKGGGGGGGKGRGRKGGGRKGKGGGGKGRGRNPTMSRELKEEICAAFLKRIDLPAKLAKRKRNRAVWPNGMFD